MQTVYRNIENIDSLTLLLTLSVAVIVLAKFYNHARFTTFLWLPFNNKYISFYSKKGKLKNWFHLLVSLFQLINISVFLYLVLKIFENILFFDSPSLFFVIAIVLFLFLSLKTLLQLIVGFIFDFKEIVFELIFNKQSYYNHSGFIILVANILLLYVFPGSFTVVYIALVSFLIINGIGLMNVLRMYQNIIANKILYFILYLCALEIAPLVIIGSYLKG